MFISIYANILRISLIAAAFYFSMKRDFKKILPISGAFVLTFLLLLFKWIFKLEIDLIGQTLFHSLVFMTIFLGGAVKFYDKYAWWDKLIHFMSGIVLVSFGIAISAKTAELSKFGALFFSFTFALALHVLWEIFEYAADCLKGSNNQRWQKVHDSKNHKPEKAAQPAGLVDTMNDTLMCVAGTVFSCVIWWLVI